MLYLITQIIPKICIYTLLCTSTSIIFVFCLFVCLFVRSFIYLFIHIKKNSENCLELKLFFQLRNGKSHSFFSLKNISISNFNDFLRNFNILREIFMMSFSSFITVISHLL